MAGHLRCCRCGNHPLPDFAQPVVAKLEELYASITSSPPTMGAMMAALSENPDAVKAFGELLTAIELAREVSTAIERSARNEIN